MSMRSQFTLVVLIAAAAAAACEVASEEQPPAPTAQERATTQSAIRVHDEPEDSLIFERTMVHVRENGLDTLAVGPLTAAIGREFVGAPYTPGLLEVPPDEGLVVNLREFDCVTYVEQMLALARTARSPTQTYAAFRDQLRRIRYRGGELSGYPSRLHYFSDWIADNDAKGIVENVTRSLGGVQDTTPIRFMTGHVEAYRQLADTVNLEAIRQREQELDAIPRYYVPEQDIAAIAGQIETGDVIAATSTQPGLDIAHTGLALWIDGRLHLMHAPLVGRSVEISELPLAERIIDIDGQDGIMVARPR